MGFGFIYLICAGITVVYIAAIDQYVERRFGTKRDDILLICLMCGMVWPFFWLMCIGIALGSFFGEKKNEN